LARPKRPAATEYRPLPWGQLGLLSATAFSALHAVALGSWNPRDPSLSVSSPGPVTNLVGPVGAVLADASYQAVGWAAWAGVLLGLACVLRLAGRSAGGAFSWFISGIALTMLTAALQLVLPGAPDDAFRPGGMLGWLVVESLAAPLGRVGAAMVVTLGLIGSITLLFRINWEPMFARAVDRVQAGGPVAVRAVGMASAATVRASARAGSAIAERWSERRAVSAARAVAARESEVDPADQEDDAEMPSVWSARPAPAPRALLPAPEPPTQSVGRTLVEVEWTETSLPRDPTVAPAPPPPRVRTVVPEERPTSSGRVPPLPTPAAAAPAGDEDPDPVDDVAAAPVAPVYEIPPATLPPSEAPPPPRRRPRGSGASVVPGNLQSGGAQDDGLAVRESSTPFQLPQLAFLDDHPAIVAATDEGRLHESARTLTKKLQDFQIDGRVSAIRPGPVITLFEYEPAPGVKLSRIASLADDLAMALKALSVRVVAPIPGRGVVGIEIPNDVRQTVWARDVFGCPEFRDTRRVLPVVLGKDTEGKPYVADLAAMPHLLVGGTTGSGKSVVVNTMLVSLLYTRPPEELRLILIDPKMLEFSLYGDIPHLLHPVVTDAKLASKVLAWACNEMDERYRLLARWGARNIANFNAKVEAETQDWTPEKARRYAPEGWPDGQLLPFPNKLPFLVIVIDELAELLMVGSSDVEASIVRLAQKARAAGIHLIVATQRPDAQTVTGAIRTNLPCRVALRVRTAAESGIILGQKGAESLLGNGDLLFLPPGVGSVTRIHGPFLQEKEVDRVSEFLRSQGRPDYAPAISIDDGDDGEEAEELDEEMARYYDQALEIALEKGEISTSMIQRHLKIGYNRACTIMEHLEREGIVGAADGAKPRRVLAQE
jgi:S-DNA-T family DNA segregation ATPase FtsK/SpoIIIE